MAEYLLGIDNGCTVSKAALFDLEGREVQVASQVIDLDYPHPGWTERSMEGVWQTTSRAIRDAIELAGVRPEQIIGVGTTGHGNGIYLLDKAGQPLRAGIVSTDTRAADIVSDWYASGRHTQVFPYTLQSLWPAQPNALLAWLKRAEPDNYARVGSVLLIKDFVKYCLTGVISTDLTDMSATSIMDSPHRSYSGDLLEAYGIPDLLCTLPPLAQSFDIVGKVTDRAALATGLLAGTPVVGGLIDIEASALGTGVFRPGQASIVCGSWSINQIVTAEPLAAPHIFMTILYTVPGLWLTVEASATSASNLEWFVKHFCAEERAEAQRRGVSVYEVCNELVEKTPPGSGGILFHPFLYGSNVQATARAGFYGVAGWHTRAHLLRALYEGVVYGHLSHIEKLQGLGSHIDTARLSGGGSRSRVWTQIFADTLRIPIEVADGSEMGARGAAMSAGIGVGAYRDHADAVARTVRIVRRQEPDGGAASLYRAHYVEYKRLLAAMREPWQHLNALQ
jgi:L-xylulokinase